MTLNERVQQLVLVWMLLFRCPNPFASTQTLNARIPANAVDTAAASHPTFEASVVCNTLVGMKPLVMLLSDTATDAVNATVRSLGLPGYQVLLRSQ